MKFTAILLAPSLALFGCGPSPAPPPTPSVLVTVVQPTRGSLPNLVTAYGSAGPALNGSETLSVPQPGQVTRLTITSGSAVRKGQPLVVFTVDPVTLSAYQQAVSALSAAQKQRATTAQLLSQQLATRDQLTQADKAVSDAAAALEALRQAGGGEAVRTLTAPFDGIVSTIPVGQGDRTQAGAALLTIAKTSAIVATVGVDPAARSSLQVGQSANIERLGVGPPAMGRVLRVDSALNPKTRQINVDLGFSGVSFLPGEAVRAAIDIGKVTGWVVPHPAVVTANGKARVYQVANGKAVAIEVTIALTGTTSDVVRGPIVANRGLIVDGAYQVIDGGAVRLADH
jgi:RND family efflux transporter MFP subunit